MQPYYERDGIRLYHGDCREIVPALGEQYAAVVTDPPYGLSFMGKGWDHDVPGVAFWQVFRDAMTPGAHLLAFGGTRVWHRLAVAIEDAGFEIKDTLMWLHGQGFPKHKSLLKPAWEPVLLARKPGTGVLQIDACRIATNEIGGVREHTPRADRDSWRITGGSTGNGAVDAAGRWPANVMLDEDAAAALDAQSGNRKSGGRTWQGGEDEVSHWRELEGRDDPKLRSAYKRGPSTGGASRFFYVAKASRAERNAGLDGLPVQESREWRTGNAPPNVNHRVPDKRAANSHPTVKPLALMEWLVTLVTPPGGTVLDPFAGSGTTGVACARLGIPCVLVEQEAEYLPIIAGRIDHALNERAAELPLFAGLEAV